MTADPQPPATPPTDSGSLYVLDAHGLIFQMFHGIRGDDKMRTADARPTNAVYGVTRALIDLYDRGAEYLIATFDCKEPTFRDALCSDYKAHRPPPPDELMQQVPMIHDVLAAMRIPILMKPGFEADDIMATLATEGAARGLNVFLCTSDKDCRQLLSDRVKIRNLRKGETLDADGLMADWGVTPAQVTDFQALVGDAVDNVPGVPGVGPKTATKWLQQYGTLDNLIAHADGLGGPKLRDAFKKAIADGVLAKSRKLVELDRRVPIDIDWVGWKRRDWDGQRLLELFQGFGYGFFGFANRVRATLITGGAKRNAEMLADMGETGSTPPAGHAITEASPPTRAGATRVKGKKPRPGQPSLFEQLDGGPEPPVTAPTLAADWVATYETIDTQPKFQAFLKALRQQKRITFDFETTGLDPLRAQIVGYAFAWAEGEAFYLPVRGPEGSTLLDPNTTLAALAPTFEDATVAKVNQNIKYERLVLRAHGVTLNGTAGDPMIADYLLHSGERSHNLDDLARRYLAHENIPITALIGTGKKQVTMDRVPVDRVCAYAGEDADVAVRLANRLEPDLDTQGLRSLYDELELPLIEVLAELEFNGIRLDVPFLAKLSDEMATQLATIETDIHAAAGRVFNIGSPKQLRVILFDEMKLPVQKRTGTTNEPSTDQESLERLAALGHALPIKIIEYRQIAKLKGTYVDALPGLVHPGTGRLHTSFNQTVASTGRLSSSDPNLQNIPARTEQGRQVRQAFLPRDGWRLVTADYSQVELRLLAHFTADPQLVRAFAEDRDIHTIVAAEIFQVPEGDVSADQRRVAKTVNFGILYGMSASGLATRLSIPKAQAAKFIDEYFARYPTVLAYQDAVLAKARRDGYVTTLRGRRRRFDPSSIREQSTHEGRTGAEREAINMEIQGSAADLMKLAMLGVYRRLRAEKLQAKMLLSVHDELVFEAPPGEVAAVAALAREEMCGAMTLTVPLKVDVAAGPNWLDVEEV